MREEGPEPKATFTLFLSPGGRNSNAYFERIAWTQPDLFPVAVEKHFNRLRLSECLVGMRVKPKHGVRTERNATSPLPDTNGRSPASRPPPGTCGHAIKTEFSSKKARLKRRKSDYI